MKLISSLNREGGGWLPGGAEPLREDLPGGGHLRQEQARHLLQEENQVYCKCDFG